NLDDRRYFGEIDALTDSAVAAIRHSVAPCLKFSKTPRLVPTQLPYRYRCNLGAWGCNCCPNFIPPSHGQVLACVRNESFARNPQGARTLDRPSAHAILTRAQPRGGYFTSTVAPASVNFFLIVSASSLEMPSLMG